MTHTRSGVVLALLGLSLGVSAESTQKAAPMTEARGTFEVKLNPQPTDSTLGRMSIDKQFHGDLEGASKGEMLAAMTAVKGSAGYVAMERVTGTVHGKKGEFILQHSGTSNRGAQSLVLTVVPDSGTGELVGLSGTMSIDIKDGKHFYTFAYAIAKAP